MSDIKIISGRNTKSVKKKAIAQGTKDLLSGASVDYFLVPKQKKGESDARYAARLWRINKDFLLHSGEGPISAAGRNYQRFKDELLARKLFADDRGFRAASRKKGEGALEWAAKNAVRSLWESEEQGLRENAISGLKKAGAWEQFRNWTRGTGAFNPSALAYNSQTGMYEYAGKVAFGWDYKKKKKGEPGGMVFTIKNLSTGKEMTQQELADIEADRALKRFRK